MSYDLAVWKRSPESPTVSPAAVYETICGDQPHPAITRFDIPAFEADIRAAFGDPDDDPDAAVLYDTCDFTGAAANWAMFTLGYSQVEGILPKLVGIAAAHGLTVYDPQQQATLVG